MESFGKIFQITNLISRASKGAISASPLLEFEDRNERERDAYIWACAVACLYIRDQVVEVVLRGRHRLRRIVSWTKAIFNPWAWCRVDELRSTLVSFSLVFCLSSKETRTLSECCVVRPSRNTRTGLIIKREKSRERCEKMSRIPAHESSWQTRYVKMKKKKKKPRGKERGDKVRDNLRSAHYGRSTDLFFFFYTMINAHTYKSRSWPQHHLPKNPEHLSPSASGKDSRIIYIKNDSLFSIWVILRKCPPRETIEKKRKRRIILQRTKLTPTATSDVSDIK